MVTIASADSHVICPACRCRNERESLFGETACDCSSTSTQTETETANDFI